MPGKQRCCATGKRCEERLSERSVQDVLMVLRSALSNAVREETIGKNPVALVKEAYVKVNLKK